jgi:hypothetical protein
MNDKMRAMLDRAVEQAYLRTAAIQKGEFHPRIDVVRQGSRNEHTQTAAKTAA